MQQHFSFLRKYGQVELSNVKVKETVNDGAF